MRDSAKRPTAATNHRLKQSGALAIAALLATAIVVATAFADKEVVDYFGAGFGSEGGQFSSPRGVAVNTTGAGPADAGDIYVADDNNHRVQRFDSEGNFISAWGADVSLPDGGTDFEICTVALECQAAANSGGNGTTAGNGTLDNPQSVAVDNDTGNVYVSDRDNRRVNVYDGEGNFVSSFGWDVDATEVATEYEVCPAANVCKGGVAGAGAGQVGSTGTPGTMGIAVSQPDGEAAVGKVFLADSANRRVGTYDLNGENPASFGSATEFGSNQPRKVAVDSRGIVYASDSNSGPQIDRYDSEDANGGGIGFLASIEVPPLLAGSGATATSGLAVDPDSDGGGADVDSLFVLRDPSSGNTRVQQFDEPGLAAAPTAVDDEHGAGAGLTSVTDLGLNEASGQLFVTATNGADGVGGQRIFVIDDVLPPPVPVLSPITVKDDKTATLSATVDPEGGDVNACKFEYSTDPSFATEVKTVNESECPTLDPEGGAQALSEEIEGLDPNTTYHVRFEVSRTFIPESAVVSGTQSFLTDQVPPYVTDVTAINVTDTSARLGGQVNPANSPASYVFEWGPTPALGNVTAPLEIGGGVEPIVVSQSIEGLAKDADYFFRLVAANEFGTTTGATQEFHTRAEPLPNPANRAFEQVSPVDKNWGDAITGTPTEIFASSMQVGHDGEAIAYSSVNGFADPAGQILLFQAQYASHRGPAGWGTRPLAPPACSNDVDGYQFFLQWAAYQRYVSKNIERAVIPQREAATCAIPPLDPAAPLPATNLYRVDLLANPVGYELLAPQPDTGSQTMQNSSGDYAAADEDFSNVVYRSNGQQTVDAPAGNFEKLYEWDEGTLRLVSVDPEGNPFGTSSRVPKNLGEADKKADAINSVSASGERIFFHNPVSGNSKDLYMREAATTTHRVSESECTTECGTSRLAELEWADVDGDVAFFSTGEKLVDADPTGTSGGSQTTDLYVYRHSADPTTDSNLTLVSVDEEPADGLAGGGPQENGFLEVLGVSDDGNTAFFTAGSQLVAGAPTGEGEKIYRWRWNGGAPALDYLATASQDKQGEFENSHWERRTTPDGGVLMIETSARVVPAADADADIDVYLWRAGKGWTCVSCQPPGDASGGASTTGRTGTTRWGVTGEEQPMDRSLGTAISEDGERVFFISQDALVPADTNSPCAFDPVRQYFPCTDVYEWHDGGLALVTTGTGSTDTNLIGASADAQDVFIFTREKLVGWDIDKFIDIYDARVGGGFPEPPPQPPECEGEGCRDDGTAEPVRAGAGSAVFQGPANRALKAKARRRCAGNRLRRGKRCLPLRAVARKRCRRLSGKAKRRCVVKQTRRLRRAQRRRAQRQRAKRRRNARAANTYRRATR